jgi:NTP pyrophosphatase (non-canonical NTP hydrolase)
LRIRGTDLHELIVRTSGVITSLFTGRYHSVMDDGKATVKELQNEIAEFCTERDWDQFHNPKDLAIGVSTEAGELLELFRFKDAEGCKKLLSDPKGREDVCDELADVFYFVLRFAQMNNIDLSQALSSKLEKNRAKYPVEKSKGCSKKYNEY